MAAKLRFGVYELDCGAMELRKQGMLVRLQEQPLRVLILLLERPGEVIPREELQQKIWGNTFVEYEQSLNKVVNRIREALDDDAGNPRFVETIPRRGYRFIAPVTAIPPVQVPSVAAVAITQASVTVTEQKKPSRRTFGALGIAAAVIGLVVAVGITSVLWQRHRRNSTLPEPRHISNLGWSPTLSRDGKLLVYVSHADTDQPHIWVRQTAAGEAIPITGGSFMDLYPDFSPDGTQVVFMPVKNNDEIDITPTLPGQARVLIAEPNLGPPRFSPQGNSVLFLRSGKPVTLSVTGGQPVPLHLSQDFTFLSAPIWSPGADKILFYGFPQNEAAEAPSWWIVPLGSGSPKSIHPPEGEKNSTPSEAIRAWVRTTDNHEWVVYSTTTPDSWKLWRIRVSPQDSLVEEPELLAFGHEQLNSGGSMSPDGQLAYATVRYSASIYQITLDGRGEKAGPTVQLGADSAFFQSPSVSRDGQWMAYDDATFGKRNTEFFRDLNTGTTHVLDEEGRASADNGEVSLSPDGSKAIFERDCVHGVWPDDHETPMPCGFMVAVSGGRPDQICENCTPRGFSADGSLILLQKYDLTDLNNMRIDLLDLGTRKEHTFLSDPEGPPTNPYFSWDGRWVVFKKMQPNNFNAPPQLMIAPVRGGEAAPRTQWIAVTARQYMDDKPQFSADGNMIYFTSTRDDYLCIWAQRLNPATKHPVGKPFAVEHFHNMAGRVGAVFRSNTDLSVSRDKILINLPIGHTDVWMTQAQ